VASITRRRCASVIHALAAAALAGAAEAKSNGAMSARSRVAPEGTRSGASDASFSVRRL
jgi:hypothetical protein